MKGVKELKKRIKSVGSIRKITRAMEMVAATKLRRLQERSQSTRPFADKIEQMIRRVSGHVDPSFSPLLQEPASCESEAIVVVAGDRGLCGSYNANLGRHLAAHVGTLKEQGVTPQLVVFGKRAQSFISTKLPQVQVLRVHEGIVEKIEYREVQRTVQDLTQGFLAGRFQRVRVIYTGMKTLASFQPRTADLLPIPRQEQEESFGTQYILEPSPRALLERLLPRFLEMQLFAALLEALTSEFSARRMAMKSATDNAGEMIDHLTMQYNKARQGAITSELLDIIGGAEAQA